MLNLIGPQYYQAAATLEFVPAWLQFLEQRELLAAEQRALALKDLRKLIADAAPIWEQYTGDPTIRPNIRRAWKQA